MVCVAVKEDLKKLQEEKSNLGLGMCGRDGQIHVGGVTAETLSSGIMMEVRVGEGGVGEGGVRVGREVCVGGGRCVWGVGGVHVGGRCACGEGGVWGGGRCACGREVCVWGGRYACGMVGGEGCVRAAGCGREVCVRQQDIFWMPGVVVKKGKQCDIRARDPCLGGFCVCIIVCVCGGACSCECVCVCV